MKSCSLSSKLEEDKYPQQWKRSAHVREISRWNERRCVGTPSWTIANGLSTPKLRTYTVIHVHLDMHSWSHFCTLIILAYTSWTPTIIPMSLLFSLGLEEISSIKVEKHVSIPWLFPSEKQQVWYFCPPDYLLTAFVRSKTTGFVISPSDLLGVFVSSSWKHRGFQRELVAPSKLIFLT